MHSVRTLFGLLALLAVCEPGFARAGDLALVGGANFYKPSLNPEPAAGTDRSTNAAFDFGALASRSLGGAYRLESGLIRHSRSRELRSATATTQIGYRSWMIPLSLQFMRAEFLGFGFGPYLAILESKSDTRTTSSLLGNSRTKAKDPNRAGVDLGLRANLRIAIPVGGDWKAIGDFSYLLGFTDLNKSPVADDKNQEILLLVGLQIPFSSLRASENPSAVPGETP